MLTLDATLALSDRVSGGVNPTLVDDTDAQRVVSAVLEKVEQGTLGFWNLPDDLALAKECAQLASTMRQKFDQLVVLGIGGSSLGGRMLQAALAGKEAGRVRFVDNVDPHSFARLIEELGDKLDRTAFNVISKSGGTVETAAQFVSLRALLIKKLGQEGYRERFVATTDPEKGLLHDLAKEEGLKTLPIPGNVGGRFSVFTAVGLFPAAFMGIDVAGLLRGAAAMRPRCARFSVEQNPALLNAIVHHHAERGGRPIHVFMPYCDRLRPFGEWYVQLWAESLGKAERGPTPLVALGATDQHSQIQLYVEGPQDKLLTFVAVTEPGEIAAFPDELPNGYGYLQGNSMAKLIDAERRGTTLALAKLGRPSVTLTVPQVDAQTIGEMVFLYEAQTAFGGELAGINAFDQPGVEMGKRIAFGLMGRDGFEGALGGLEAFQEPNTKRVLAD